MDKSGTNSSSDDIDAVDVDAVSELLRKEMSELSLQEQYIINQDVNGLNTLATTEPPILSSAGLEALDKQLRATDGDYPCYRSAVKLGSKMVKERQFRLKFARADRFDPIKSANRIESYLKILSQHFGDEHLKRPIRLDDLDKLERDLLKSGVIQVLPYRDRAGRKITAVIGNVGASNHSLKQKMKVLTYIVQVLSEDKETQRQGCVVLFWPVDSTCTLGSELSHVLQVAPIRFSSFHFMLNDTPEFRKLAAWQLQAMPLEWRVRTRLHFGSIHQCQNEIKAYGIPSSFLPITNTGNIKVQNHLKWITFRQVKETSIGNGIAFHGIDCPSVKDVLTGKGPHVSSNPANVAYRKMMETRFLEHRDALTAERKTMISREIVDELLKNGGRFLVKEKSWWEDCDPDTAREKVSVAFRDMRKTFLAQEKKKAALASKSDSEGDEKKRKRTS